MRHFSANAANWKNSASNAGYCPGISYLLDIIKSRQLKEITQIVYPELFKDSSFDRRNGG